MPQLCFGVSKIVISMSWGEIPNLALILSKSSPMSLFFASTERPSNMLISIMV